MRNPLILSAAFALMATTALASVPANGHVAAEDAAERTPVREGLLLAANGEFREFLQQLGLRGDGRPFGGLTRGARDRDDDDDDDDRGDDDDDDRGERGGDGGGDNDGGDDD